MSSHHFVKEGQEPALFILEDVDVAHAEALLEWSPFVVTHEALIDEVLLWGIKVDLVLAKEEKIDVLKEKLFDQAPVKILSYSGDGLVETAMLFLARVQQTAVNVLVNHKTSWLEKLQPFTDLLSINLLSGGRKWSSIPSGSLKKWFPSNTTIFFHRAEQTLVINGVVCDADSYVTKTDGIVEIVNNGAFWLGEVL